MTTCRRIDRVCVIILILSILLSAAALAGKTGSAGSGGTELGYESRLFDTSRVHTLDIVMDDWEDFLAGCESEEYSACAVVIDGESCKNAAIRAKGNTSLSSVSAMGSSRYSFKIEFDHYDSGKTYHGLDKLNLNNLIFDNTMMKDYLVYRMMAQFGVDAPLCSFVFVTVNGEDFGLYLAVEGVEDSFLARNYGGTGALYKPDSQSFGAGRGNGRDFAMDAAETYGGEFRPSEDAAQPPSRPDGGSGGFRPGGGAGSEDVKLQYIDDDPDSYPNLFGSAKTDITESDEKRLIASLKSLSSYENLEEVLDTDEVLRYFVVHSFVVNGDSYTGSMIHNYYLYENDGRLSMIPWDYNLAFGTFQSGSAESAVNDSIDAVLADRPMQAWIFSDERCTEQYHALYAEFLETVDADALIDEACSLITPYVEADPTKFCTTEEFETGVAALRTFCELRSRSAAAQLSGDTAEISAEGLTLSDMGTMQGGAAGGPPSGSEAFPDRTGSGSGAPSGDSDSSGTDRAPSGGGGGAPDGFSPPDAEFTPPDTGFTPPDGGAAPQEDGTTQSGASSGLLWTAISAAVLLAALLFAWLYRKRI